MRIDSCFWVPIRQKYQVLKISNHYHDEITPRAGKADFAAGKLAIKLRRKMYRTSDCRQIFIVQQLSIGWKRRQQNRCSLSLRGDRRCLLLKCSPGWYKRRQSWHDMSRVGRTFTNREASYEWELRDVKHWLNKQISSLVVMPWWKQLCCPWFNAQLSINWCHPYQVMGLLVVVQHGRIRHITGKPYQNSLVRVKKDSDIETFTQTVCQAVSGMRGYAHFDWTSQRYDETKKLLIMKMRKPPFDFNDFVIRCWIRCGQWKIRWFQVYSCPSKYEGGWAPN